MNLDEVRRHLSKGRTETALQTLINALRACNSKEAEQELEDALHLQANFAKAKRHYELNQITYQEYDSVTSKTIAGIQTILKNLEQLPCKGRKVRRVWLVLPILLVLLLLIIWLLRCPDTSDKLSTDVFTAPDSAVAETPPRTNGTPKNPAGSASEKGFFKEISAADDLIYFQQWASAYRKYQSIYDSLPEPLKKKFNRDDIAQAKRKYNAGNWDEAAKLMKANFDHFKNTIHNQK